MPWRLLKYGLTRSHPEPRMFTPPDALKSGYDVVIIGAGGHGLASAYYLARDHGIRNIAVIEKGYVGGGNTGRNTTIIRSNYLTPEGVQFYDESIRLWQDLSQDFDLNLFYSTRGHFTLAHTDASMRTMRWRAEVNKHFSVDSEVVDAQAVHEAIPHMDMSAGGHAPVLGALYHAPGAIARHDAVAWGYGRGADRRGVEIHQNTEVLGIETEDTGSGPRVKAVVTSRGRIETRKVLCAVAGSTPRHRDARWRRVRDRARRAPARARRSSYPCAEWLREQPARRPPRCRRRSACSPPRANASCASTHRCARA